MRIEMSSRSCVFRGRELRFGADSWKKLFSCNSLINSWITFKKSNHKNALEAHFCDLISGEKPNSWLFDENVKKSNHAPRRAHDLISGEKPNSCPPPPTLGGRRRRRRRRKNFPRASIEVREVFYGIFY